MKYFKSIIGTIAGISLAYTVEAQSCSLSSVQKDTARQVAMNLNVRNTGDLEYSRPDPQEVLSQPSMLQEYTNRMIVLMNMTATDKEPFMEYIGETIMEKLSQYHVPSVLNRTTQEAKNEREFLQKAVYIEEEQLEVCNRYIQNVKAQRQWEKRAIDMGSKIPITPGSNAAPEQIAAYQQQRQQWKQEEEQLAKELGVLVAEADDIAQQIANVHPISRELRKMEKRKVLEEKSIWDNDNLKDAGRLHNRVITVFRMACKNEYDVRGLYSLLIEI